MIESLANICSHYLINGNKILVKCIFSQIDNFFLIHIINELEKNYSLKLENLVNKDDLMKNFEKSHPEQFRKAKNIIKDIEENATN